MKVHLHQTRNEPQCGTRVFRPWLLQECRGHFFNQTTPTHLRMSTMNLAIAGGTIVDAAQLYPSQLTRLTERLRTICRWLTDTMKQPGRP